jgi:DNA-binding NarL/FixJ family response regulator
MSATPVRVILADDHTLVRAGIRRIIESHPEYVVVGEAADGHEAIAALRQTDADVMVLDLKMEGREGIDVLRVAKAERPTLKVVVLTMHASREYVSRTMEEGANGYLLKDSAVQDLAAAIDAVMAGRSYFSPMIQQQMAEILKGDAPSSPDVRALTGREREVFVLLARGMSTKEIASTLDIGVRTAETHRSNVMRKLGVRSVAVLTQVAIREGVLDIPAP